MFSVRSRLASVLQPWLLAEPDLETKLGFLRSYGSAKNLRLDVSVLNNQFTDDSTGWCFKEVKVENLSIQISPWSVPAFTVEVHGVYVILSPREWIDEEGSHHMQSSFDRSDMEKKKILSVIDSEGTALHDIIERISAVASAKNQLMTTFMNVILKNCQLQMHDIHLEVQLPVTDGCVTCLLKIKEVGLEVEHLDNTCLLAGLIRGLFVLEKETSLVVNASGLEVELMKEEHVKSVFSSVDLFTCIKLKDLQLLNLEVRATQLEIAFCPVDIATFLLFDTLSSKEVKHCRTGRELWNIAANRIGSLTSNPMLSLHKAVDFVGLWLRHVRAYESLLLLIGYPAESILRRTAVRMSHDKMFLTHMKQQWKVISEIEKGLPVEALASARRVARYRAAMCVQHSQRINSEPPVQVHNTFIWKILSVLSFIWKHLCWIFQSVVCLFFVRDSLDQHQELDEPSGVVSEVFLSQYCISLELGKISIIVYPINEVPPAVGGNSESYTGFTHLNLLSFCMVVEAFFLNYTVGTTVQSLSLSCGDFKVKSSSLSVATVRERNSRNDSNCASRGRRKEKIHDSKAVIWSEPASQFLFLDKVVTGSVSSTGNFWFLHLENYLEEMWSNWKRIRKKLKGSKAQYLESPFILCEITSFLRDPCLHMPISGLWRCCLTLGKLNIDLGYSSIMSAVLLLRQIQHTLSCNANRRTRVSSNFPSTIGEPKEIKWEDYFESYTSRMKMAMLRMMPEKNIQVGVAIAGPTIRVSLQEEALLIPKEKDVHPIFTQGHGDSFFAFDLGNIELAVWPTQETHLAALTGCSRLDKVGNEPLLVKEPLSINIPKSDSFISQGRITLDSCWRINGLNAYLQDLEENRQWQVIVLKSIIIQSSSCKEYLHSFTTNASNLSTSFCGMANGVAALSYMDELWVIFQVVGWVLSTMSYVFTSLDFVGGVQFQEVIRRNNLFSIQDTDGVAQAYEVKAAALILKNTHFTCDANFDFGPLDIILHNSRKVHIMENCMKFYVASCNKKITFDIPEHGIGVSIQRSRVHLSSKEEDPLKVLIDILGIQAIIFRYQSPTGEYSYDQLIDLYHQSENFSCGVTLSSCTLALSFTSPGDALACGRVSDTVDGSTSGSKSSPAVEDPPAILSDGSNNIQLNGFNQTSEHGRLIASDILAPPSIYPVLINVTVHEIVMAGYSVKNALIGAHQPKRLVSSLSIGREFHSISWEIQGGLVVLETAALATFLRCFNLYLVYITKLSSIIPSWGHLSSGGQSETVQPGEEIARSSNNPSKKYAQGTVSSFSQPEPISKYQSLEVLMIRLTDFSLVLVADECGQIWEFLLEVDFHLKLELMNLRRKLLFDNSRLTILSQRLHDSCAVQIIKGIQVPHFLSATFSELSSISVSGDLTLPLRQTKGLLVFGYTYSSGSPASQKESTVDDDISGWSRFDHRNNILKHAAASLMVEKAAPGDEVGFLRLKDDWVGVGSVSGVDLTISLSEIQMLMSLLQPLSGVSSVESTVNSKQKQYSSIRASNSGSEEDTVSSNSGSEDTVPDGAVVAIQDIQQHMFFAVEYSEEKYRLAGTIHYSLVGERSLFRVKYCARKRWGVPVPWFTLISLHAKSRSGEPLQLNYHRGSGFVDISSTDNNDWALWRTIPYNSESYEGDSDLESYMQSSKNTFYLVNKKCDCAVAFVDGVPEFVKKPGNPFKMKVFHDVCVARDPLILGTSSGGDCETDLRQNREIDEGNTSSRRSSNFPYVNITIEKVSLTIVHEVSNASNKFQLVQGCINDIHFMVQVLPSKLRLISTFTAVVFHFDAQNNLWREVVQPVEMCIYYRSRFASEDLEIAPRGMPVHFYFRTKQVDVYVTELSLDILLFMVGELNLAGPYAVRSSMIFANCCKVENLSGLNLRCHFNDDQDVTIAGRQSASIFLRHAAVANQFPESLSVVSVQLVVLGAFSTSPIHVSLLNAQVLAWRTRVVSLQDSKTSPGPFVVVDISKKTEDGLSIVVSPLLRIHNETGFSMELRFRRPQQKESESVSAVLRAGDTIDDSMIALDAMNLCGGSKKALMSLNLGNFLFSFRPVIKEFSGNTGKPVAIEWSEDLKGGKAVCLSGIFDKLTYKVKRAFKVESLKYSLSTVQCSLSVEGAHLTDVHFLIQTIGRNVPVKQPENFRDIDKMPSPVALQEQKEIFLLPTVHVSNFLQSEIHVLITETHPGNSSTFRSPTCVIMSLPVKRLSADQCTPGSSNHTGKEATIPCGSSACLYGNPTMIYFTVTLTAFSSSCKPVNSGDWVKKLHKQKHNVHYLDIDLDFGGGKYFASLRLLRGDRGILEAAVFTSYTLHNDSDLTLFCFSSNLKPLSRMEADKFGSSLPPERGLLLPPKITRSWFLKSNRVQLVLLEEKASVALLDLDALSRFTELCLEVDDGAGVRHITKLGVSLKQRDTNVAVPSQTVTLVPRYVLSNESQESIILRQCYLEDDRDGIVAVNSKKKTALHMKSGPSKKREIGFVDSLFRKHRNTNEDSLMFIQFCLNEVGWSWSGPICVASLGRFFLKFRRPLDSLGQQSNLVTGQENKLTEFAVVHIVEEGSTLVLRFHSPPNIRLPYRIENFLCYTITYYQKESVEPEVLGSGGSANYVWDDLNLPHKLVVHIPDMRLSREINMDKVCRWKPFSKVRQNRGLALRSPLDKKPEDRRRTKDDSHGLEMLKVGYEVYADGPTRVLRISEFPDSDKEVRVFQPCAKIQLRVSFFSVHLLEHGKQDEDASETSSDSTLIVARLGNINLDSISTDRKFFNQIRIQSLNVDEKWAGAPFAAMLRRNQLDYSDANGNILQIVFILLSTDSNVKQVTYSSIVLQPINLSLDEETLMRLVPFWRTSLSESNIPSQQFYFEHFEIHPIKIVASFLPGSSDSSYTSAQETLRSLLHSVIKIPTVKNMDVELNGILVTHALVTVRELLIKCAQHYSWYAMRAIYIAKGSPLLPPSFASIFDDSASSSLDVFFDPSSGSINLPGITLGMFKFISKCVRKKGFSGTKRYFGDLGKTVKTAGSNVLFAAVTEISDCILRGAETNGFNGMMNGFHQGILKLAMEPSLLGSAVMEGGPDRKIKLDRNPGVDELYIEGYLQAMLDAIYKQEYLRVRVIENQVILKNLPPNTSLINEIMERVKSFLISKALLKGELPANSRYLHHLRGDSEWKIGPTILTLCEHLFVSFSIRMLRKQAGKVIAGIKQKAKSQENEGKAIVPASVSKKLNMKRGIGKFIFSGMLAYVDGRLCRCIPNAIVRRIVSGFLLSFLDKSDND